MNTALARCLFASPPLWWGWAAGLLAGLALLLAGPARAEQAIPPLAARVTDLTATLTSPQRQALEQKLADLEQAKGSQIAVLILPTTQPETVEQYAIRVAEAWKLGRKGVDDGVLLLVAKDDRTVRIEVGYGLEGVIPDATAKRIIEEIIVPRFRQGDYHGGIVAGVDALIARISGEPLPPPQDALTHGGGEFLQETLPVAMMFVFLLGGFLRGLMGRLPGAGLAGGIAFFGGWLLLGSLPTALIIGLIVFFITLTGGGTRGGYRGGGGNRSGRLGGRGGFSGGGGGFGGGGASGRW